MKDWMRQRSGDWKIQPQTQIGKKIEKNSREQIKDRIRQKRGDLKRQTLIDVQQSEIEKGRLKKIDVNLD